MRTPFRRLICPAAVTLCLFGGAAYADPIVITSGGAALYNPVDVSGIRLVGEGTLLIGDGFGSWFASVNPATNIGVASGGFSVRDNVPFGRQQTVNGTTYSNVFLSGGVTFTAAPFTVPTPVPGLDRAFSTRFVATGQLSGFTSFVGGTPLFTVDVVGGGVLSFSGRVSPGSDGPFWNFASRGAGATFDALDSPAATPEPGTMLLFGSAIVALALKCRRNAAQPSGASSAMMTRSVR